MAEHPLSLLAAEDINATRKILDDAQLIKPETRFAYLGLQEPEKHDLYDPSKLADIHRIVRVFLLDIATGESLDIVVDLSAGSIVSVKEVDGDKDGHFPVLLEEFESIEDILATEPSWVEALATRGLTPQEVKVAPLSPGVFDYEDEEGKRMLRGLAFHKQHEKDNAFAHPIDNLVVFVDMIARKVHRIIDHGPIPIPQESGNFSTQEDTGPLRTSLKPLEIIQVDGPSFTVVDNKLTWENWDMRVGFDAREGLILHSIGFFDKEKKARRPIIHRASIAEMVVPYGDPSPFRSWQNYFDTGEYLIGRDANSLELGCDCLGVITYLSPVVSDDHGHPRTITQAVCIHEEDYGILWKHTDEWSGVKETRRQRRIVISFFATVGNYDYGFYWYFYLDGTIEFEAKATGVVFTSATQDPDYAFATEIAPGLTAPFHQHLFCARLDMMIDGHNNTVDEVEAIRFPTSDTNKHGNAFSRSRTSFAKELEAQRVADNGAARVWEIKNVSVKNRLGKSVAYTLYPEGNALLLAADGSSISGRATFATKHLWVTAYEPDERYPAGDYANRSRLGSGLPSYTAGNRDIENTDIVLWHTFGLTHFPRTEDWPVMPVDYTGFVLKPNGFFDRNPTLDVPATVQSHGGKRSVNHPVEGKSCCASDAPASSGGNCSCASGEPCKTCD